MLVACVCFIPSLAFAVHPASQLASYLLLPAFPPSLLCICSIAHHLINKKDMHGFLLSFRASFWYIDVELPVGRSVGWSSMRGQMRREREREREERSECAVRPVFLASTRWIERALRQERASVVSGECLPTFLFPFAPEGEGQPVSASRLKRLMRFLPAGATPRHASPSKWRDSCGVAPGGRETPEMRRQREMHVRLPLDGMDSWLCGRSCCVKRVSLVGCTSLPARSPFISRFWAEGNCVLCSEGQLHAPQLTFPHAAELP
mmetsp:Transcript_47143/g.117589  ORF Transcript_47143/g.117589 Transcript_47143/m.117589 type:complete len:262 (-) Transcript_47143:715-1500(-)